MKILMGLPEYPPYHTGGGGEVYKQLVENYHNLGHEIVVLYGYYPNKKLNSDIKSYRKDGIKFYQIPEIPYPAKFPFTKTVMPPTIKAWNKIEKIIKKENPDVAHLHGYGLPLINIFSSVLKKNNIDYVFTIHGYPESQNRFFITKWIWNIYIKLFMNPTLRKARAIGAISNYIKKNSLNICQEKTHVIFNGINFSEYKNIKNKIDIRKIENIKKDQTIIFSLGRITQMKGFHLVVSKIPEMIKNGLDPIFLIAGKDDGYKDEIESLSKKLKIEKRVKFVSYLNEDDKRQYLDQCDIFAVPSLREPFGLVALEGVAAEKPILTTYKAGLKEVLSSYNKKILIDKKIKKDTIKNLLNKKVVFNNEDFNWKKIAKKYIKLLKSE